MLFQHRTSSARRSAGQRPCDLFFRGITEEDGPARSRPGGHDAGSGRVLVQLKVFILPHLIIKLG